LGTLTATLGAPSKLEHASGEVILVSDRIPQAERLVALNREYRDEIRRTKLEIDQPEKLTSDIVPGVKASANFVGSDSCLVCHTTAAQSWSHSRHAEAFRSLVASKADADPNCISCHTVGFGSVSGYRREYGELKLTNVGCESCHGPGSMHVAARQGGQLEDRQDARPRRRRLPEVPPR
jgi:nitrate/TMAO reductase-like tetraheme cytochrome c subunit